MTGQYVPKTNLLSRILHHRRYYLFRFEFQPLIIVIKYIKYIKKNVRGSWNKLVFVLFIFRTSSRGQNSLGGHNIVVRTFRFHGHCYRANGGIRDNIISEKAAVVTAAGLFVNSCPCAV